MKTDPYRWLTAYRIRDEGPLTGTQSATYSLNEVAAKGFLSRDDIAGLLVDAQLRDFVWRVTWSDDRFTPDDQIDDQVLDADGYVIFIHGWTGTRDIWEDMPALVVQRNPRLVAITVDHNGFGESSFIDPMPDFDICNPIAAMKVIERWLEMLKPRRQPGDPRLKTINYVGHSMGGAALFFVDESQYRLGEQTRLAIAPALLLDDQANRTFFTTLGLGIGLVGRLRILEVIDDLISPSVLEALAEGATDFVKEIHANIYENTPKSVTARVLAAMGVLKQHPTAHTWDLMEVFLGHKDRLVALVPMLNLLEELDFDVDQIHVTLGTHYLFSIGDDRKKPHQQNRELVIDHILELHERGLKRQRTGE
jgi:pimeloyl-ACP methyl ester carboxylesterase